MPPITDIGTLYKYRLHELFIKHFGAKYAEAKEVFCKQSGIPLGTLQMDCRLTIDNPKPIDGDRLQKYAALFNISIDELRNRKPENKAA